MAENGKTHSSITIEWLRVALAAYFFVYAYIVARSLIPLPDQSLRIDFRGLMCVVLGLVIGFHCLTSSYRLFQIGTWFFLLMAYGQLTKKIKFLDMMLEPQTIETVTRYSIGLIMLVLLSPQAFRLFSKPASEYRRGKLLFVKRGYNY